MILSSGVPLRVEIDLFAEGRDLTPAVKEAIRGHVLGLATDLGLAADLGLPAAPDVQITPTGRDGSTQRGPRFAIRINGTACRIDHAEVVDAPVPPDPARIGEALFRNRSLLATGELASAVTRHLDPGRGPAAAADGIVSRTLSRAFDLCLDLPAARQLCGIALRAGDTDEVALETELHAADMFGPTVRIELGAEQYHSLPAATEGDASFSGMTSRMRDGLFLELGVRLPKVEAVFDETLDDRAFRLRINRVRAPLRRGLGSEDLFVHESADRLGKLGIRAVRTTHPINGAEAAIISRDAKDACRKKELTTWDPAEYLVLCAEAELRRVAPVYQTVRHAERALRMLDGAFPQLVLNAYERFSLLQIAEILRALVAEDVSVRDLRGILISILEANRAFDARDDEDLVVVSSAARFVASGADRPTLGTCELIEAARLSQHEATWHRLLRGGRSLPVYPLASSIVDACAAEPPERWSADQRARLLAAIGRSVGGNASRIGAPPILTRADIRPRVRRLIEMEFPRLLVLSRSEVPKAFNIRELREINWDEPAQTGPA